MTSETIKSGVATLLFLGQHFKHGKTIWENILAQLGLNCTKEELLFALNSIGKQQSARVLIMIDAINEGPGKDIWGDALAGFIEDVKRYPFVGLVLSIRTTYFNAIIPKALQTDSRITYRTHQGFKGNEYAALKLFCEHYGLHTPNFPILAPEFTSPLFLQLICQGIKASGKKEFPQGFQGITQIFDYYIDAIYNKLVSNREEYKHRKPTIRKAINTMAQACFEKEFSLSLSTEEIVLLFDNNFPHLPHLLDDLIQENVFIQTLIHDYRTSKEEEVVYFSYERFGDFFIAEQLLSKYTTIEDIENAFQKEGELGKLIGHHSWRNTGVLEAISVRLPEKHNIEITEVCGWAFDKTDDHDYWNVDRVISNALWDSLKWRTPASIDNEKITAWLRSDQCKIGDEDYFLRLVELTTIQNHPFNSDRLFLALKHHTMPDRDGFWQEHMLHYTGYNDDKDAFPLQRLIDWAWQKGISFLIEPETARLAGQTLAWMLSSTQVRLRDQTTKAMVNLLEEQPEALIKILEAFADTDDMYIAERLYAVAYGCALRTSSDVNLKKIADYVYQAIFKDGNPPVHVLLRDYARNVIEYANYKGLNTGINMELVKPPYNSSFPSELPTEADINQYETKFEEADSDIVKERKRMYGKIHFDMMSWDFGEKTVESILRDFSSCNFTVEKKFLHFKKGISRQGKSWLNLLVDIVEAQVKLEAQKRGHRSVTDRSLKDSKKTISELYCSCTKNLKKLITPKEWKDLTKVFVPFLKDKFAEQKRSYHSYDTSPIKRWLVQRAYDLGYDTDKHFEYDSIVDRHRQYRDYKANRIGEKYQWIALHEIVARLGDNYYYNSYFGHNRGKRHFYQGPWEQYIRDIDPAFTTKNSEEEEDKNLLHSHASIPKGWWFNTDYNNWSDSPSEWAANKTDLPPLENIILCKDDNGEEWVYLKAYIKWGEPKKIGQDRYNSPRKEVLYMINAYLTKKATKKNIIKHLTGKNFFGRWMPETHNINLSLFNRENYWSPPAIVSIRGQKKWETIEDTSYKVIITTSDAVGEMSQDKSDAHIGYVMPSKTLFDGMGLKFSSEDGSFNNSAGDIVVKSIGTDTVLIRRKELNDFLEQNNYDIFWTILGEKNFLDGLGTNNKSELRAISGLYHFENGKIIGDMFTCNRNGEDAH